MAIHCLKKKEKIIQYSKIMNERTLKYSREKMTGHGSESRNKRLGVVVRLLSMLCVCQFAYIWCFTPFK